VVVADGVTETRSTGYTHAGARGTLDQI
jgi:hypothetical protein